MAVLAGVRRRGVAWGVAVAGAAAAVGLTLVALLVDLDTADRVASLVGAVAGLAGLGFSAYALVQPDGSGSGGGNGSGNGGGSARVVRARGRGAVAAGGDVTGNAFGASSRTVNGRPGPQPPTPRPSTPGSVGGHVSARGDGAVAAEGDVRGNAFGDGSEADSR
ncbi:hypothetical protein ABZ921_36910 [Streptomyces atriruber]|uniref:Uncharacterized protein n=1 Tax=Streptomyces atriruber TaxID=545121 RepID=A0ABV3BYY5_9ACTN